MKPKRTSKKEIVMGYYPRYIYPHLKGTPEYVPPSTDRRLRAKGEHPQSHAE